MNNTSLILFDISHVLRNVRDTLEFLVPNKEIDVKVFENRKKVVGSILEERTFLGTFLKNNEDKLAEFKKNYQEFFDEVYGDDSTILVKTNEGKVRVDHAQDITVIKGVNYLGETLREVLYSHMDQARKQNALEETLAKHVDLDERIDRAVKFLVALQSYEKSFVEFQKVMREAQGKPTPQSNFIVQNELTVLAGVMRFERDHCRMIDNHTLDVFDQVIELLQMCEGRRERRDNKNFPDLFKECIQGISGLINEFGPKYDESYNAHLKEMIDHIKSTQGNPEENNKA